MNRDRGAGSVLVVSAAAVVALTGVLMVLLGQVAIARHRAAAAADLAAWAAAARALDGPKTACATARQVAGSAGATLLSCRLTANRAIVVAAVPTRLGSARASGSWPFAGA